MKPIYKIIIAVLILIVLALGAYFAWKKIASPSDGALLPDEITPTLPLGEDGQPLPVSPVGELGEETQSEQGITKTEGGVSLMKLSESPAFAFWIAEGTKELYYITPQGAVFAAKDGPDLELGTQVLDALNFVTPAPKGVKLLAAFGDPAAPSWGIFDIADKAWKPLPAGILNATWGENDATLLAIFQNGGVPDLVQMDVSKNTPTYITLVKNFRLKDISLAFKSPQTLFITEKAASVYQGRLWSFDIKTFSLQLLVGPFSGLMTGWSSDLATLFTFSRSEKFSMYDASLRERAPFLFSSFPTKCDVAASSALCFVPENLQGVSRTTLIPDDYLSRKIYSVDTLRVTHITEGGRKPLLVSNAEGIPPIDAAGVRARGSDVYFINRYDNALYKVTISQQ